MVEIISNKIQRGFSQAADSYDRFSMLHREIADKLFGQVIKEAKHSVILDVGCGTGYLTVKLKDYWPQSGIVGLDFAKGMLQVAGLKHDGITWILADGHQLPFVDGNFELVVSNLAYQWAGDLAQAFVEARRVLADGGVLACTLFGYHTCQELFESLEEAVPGKLKFTRLPKESQVQQALISSGFESSNVESQQLKIEFKDMNELMGWLKSIGANNLSRDGFLGRQVMVKAASIYREKFFHLKGVAATFEVIRIYAKK